MRTRVRSKGYPATVRALVGQRGSMEHDIHIDVLSPWAEAHFSRQNPATLDFSGPCVVPQMIVKPSVVCLVSDPLFLSQIRSQLQGPTLHLNIKEEPPSLPAGFVPRSHKILHGQGVNKYIFLLILQGHGLKRFEEGGAQSIDRKSVV